MSKYDSYSQTGNEWLPVIPSHWRLSTLGRHFDVILGKMLCPKPLDATYSLEEYYCAGDVHFDGVNTCDLKKMWFSQDEKSKYCVQSKDLLIVEGGAGAGGCSVVSDCEKDRYIQNSILIARHPSNSTVYLKYLVETLVRKGYIVIVCNEATFAHFTKDKVCHVPYPVIPIDEQRAMATWLDEKCGEIDAAIAKVDREIELIDELKQSEISRVVTRGLNPNVKLRSSGIDWIGNIPEHWKYIPVKYFFYLKGRIGWQGLKADEFKEEGPFLVTGTDFENGRVDWKKCYRITEERFNEAPEIHVKEGDLLITKDGTVGKLAYIEDKPEKVSLNSHLLIIRPLSDLISNKYVFWYCNSKIFKDYSGLIQDGSIMASLSQEDFSNFRVLVPPLSEQQAITDYLDKKCAEIDGLKAKLKKKRDTLVELRQSMISEVVTGKRKVV